MSEITILDEDKRYLEEKRFKYSAYSERNLLFIIISDFPFPEEFYTPHKADLLIKILPGYPMTPLDMFWTNPSINLKDGESPIKTVPLHLELFGKKWQRWSRHYANPWRPGIDNLRSFVQSIKIELNKGI